MQSIKWDVGSDRRNEVEYRYDLATEFQEAVEHAEDRGTKSKALLCMAELSVPEEVE